jgi:hypothetical protein
MNQYYNYLDEIRNSGITNMYGAGVYLQQAFGVSRMEARKILMDWMKQFGEKNGR